MQYNLWGSIWKWLTTPRRTPESVAEELVKGLRDGTVVLDNEGETVPHYKDGSEAKVGDLVRGHGYNVKHEIIGRVVNIRPGEACTLSVAFVGAVTPLYFLDGSEKPFAACHVVADIEYGDTVGFNKV